MSGYRRPRLSAGLYLGEKTAPYVAPWLLALGAMPVAVGVHFFIGDDAKWMVILGAVFTLMTLGTWRTWKHRKHETRLTATVFTGAMLGWIALAGAGTPWSGDLLKAWVVGGFSCSAFWCIRHAGVAAGHDRDRTDKEDQSWLAGKISAFKGSKVTSVKETPDEIRVRHDLETPVTAGDAQRTVDQIAAVAKVGKDQVKVLKVKGDESKVDVVLNRATDTSKPVKYRGPSAPGQSCAAAPLWLGRRTDGSDIEWWMPGDAHLEQPRNVVHTKCTGTTGAGKTETICTAVLDMRWRTDIVPVVGDPAKFQQGFGDIEECLGLAAKTKPEVLQLLENLAGPVIEYRSELLGSLRRSDGGMGYKQWEPECYTLHGVPFLFVDIEEAADVIMDRDQEVYEAARKLRSLGIKLCLSTQTMPHDDIPRKARGLFGESLAHGQKEYQDAKYALSEETLNANADPTKWGADAPGSVYAELTGTDKVHWPVDGRAVYMTAAEKSFSIEGSRQYWAAVDDGTYERLAFGIDPALAPVEEDDSDLDEYEDEEDEVIGRDAYAGVEGADPNIPLTPPPAALDISFSDGPGPEMSSADARARLMNRLEVLARSGQSEITFQDLADLPGEVGFTPQWLYKQLGLLVDAGVLKEFRPPKGSVVNGRKVKVIYTIIRKFEAS